jgi:hypothetical protein
MVPTEKASMYKRLAVRYGISIMYAAEIIKMFLGWCRISHGREAQKSLSTGSGAPWLIAIHESENKLGKRPHTR